MTTPTIPAGHVWTSAFERLGDENRMVTKCLNHPDARPLVTYDWPTQEQLAEHEEKHHQEQQNQDSEKVDE